MLFHGGRRFLGFEAFWSVPTESATGNPNAVVTMSDDPFSPSNSLCICYE